VVDALCGRERGRECGDCAGLWRWWCKFACE